VLRTGKEFFRPAPLSPRRPLGVSTGPDFKKIKIQQKDLFAFFSVFSRSACLKQLRRWYIIFQMTSMERLMSPSTRRFVAYYRVSTARQGRSGLGLEAQKAAVLAFIDGNAELVAEFMEVESGKHAEREELKKAIAACKKHKAKLVIAKLDRLSRNLAFIATLMESGVEFVAVDMPEANKLTVHILAAMAEHEREQISKRTRDALAVAKRRGKRLGNPDIAEVAKRGRAALKANARRFAANVRPIIEEIKRNGITSHNAIAAKLNERNVRTARGGTWTHVQVGAILHPFDGANTAAAA
jgi:DNA invertase Pin-like site-specific DNA recombinase